MSEEYEPLSNEERLKLACDFLLDAPPGEVNDVIRDISGLINDEENLEPHLVNSLRQYNLENFIACELPDSDDKVLITKFNHIEEDTFFDNRSKQKFKYDPVTQSVELLEELEINEELEPLREAFESSLDKYLLQHYPEGQSSVFVKDESLVAVIVGTKLSQKNFWNGRLKSFWTFEPKTLELSGKIHAQVHYYEEGNVQLNSSKEFSVTFSQESDPKVLGTKIVKEIEKVEQTYQIALNEGYSHLDETAFKGLRRTLPVTRSKFDWNQISSYKVGSEINK